MEALFRRAALACWSAILLLVLAVALLGPAGGRPAPPGLSIVDQGNDVALERAAAMQVSDAAPPPLANNGPPPPGRLLIRSIGVDAHIVPVTVDKNGAMGVTSTSWDVGWYSPGVVPGMPGDAVIDGHLDWYDTSQAVFYNLRQVRAGDDVEVQRLDGVTKHFHVTSVTTVAYNATVPGLFAVGGAPRLSLITCGGPWSQKLGQYLERVIVDAALSD